MACPNLIINLRTNYIEIPSAYLKVWIRGRVVKVFVFCLFWFCRKIIYDARDVLRQLLKIQTDGVERVRW